MKSKKVSLIDTLTIGLDRVDAIFESLKNDAEKNNFFTYRNINSARPIVERLQTTVNDVIIFSDDHLRREVLKIIDILSSLINDVNDLENYYTSENNKFKEIENKALDELKRLRVELLKHNIKVVENLTPVYILKEKNQDKNKLDEVKGILNLVDGEYTNAKKNLENTDKFCKDKRVFYAMRIVDAQAKIRELNTSLQELRDELVN